MNYLSFRAKSRNLLPLIALTLLAACTKPALPSIDAGTPVDEAALTAAPSVLLRASGSADGLLSVTLPEGGDFTSVKVYAYATRVLDYPQTLQLSVDETLVPADATLLPPAFYSIDNGGVINLAAGTQASEEKLIRIYATNPLGNTLEAGHYFLPLTASTGGSIRIEVDILAPFTGRPELYQGEDCFTVFYLNTSQFDPRLATDFVVERLSPTWEVLWHNAIGNIVNFRTVTLDYDAAAGRPILSLSADMRYLCDQFNTYFKPIKDTGRKICICIEGGGKGIGFCNMTDEQISDFTSQVVSVVNQFGFDGVNLWDRNAGYGKEGMPAMNTTSYPKLIKSLREALGPYKLLTLADYDDPTAYFWDVEAMGGIEVGQYLDYAWSGYVNGDEPVQIIDPYHQGSEFVSAKYPRKPITGLSPKRYGCVHSTWYARGADSGYDEIVLWVENGMPNNNLSIFYDIRSNLQDKYEGGIYTPDALLRVLDSTGGMYMFDIGNFLTTGSGYGKWLKDW